MPESLRVGMRSLLRDALRRRDWAAAGWLYDQLLVIGGD